MYVIFVYEKIEFILFYCIVTNVVYYDLMNNIYLKYSLNKITLKQSELKTLSDTLTYYSKELDNKFTEILVKNDIDMSFVTGQSKCIHSIENNVNDNNIVINEHKQICDTLFKQLVLLTHPDKSNNSFTDDFINIKEAFDNENVLKLLDYANKYELFNNKLDDLDTNIITVILEKELFKLKESITKLKSTIGYQMLIKGNINSYIETLKYSMQLAKENEEFKKKIDELKNRSE